MTETWTILKVLQWATDYFSHRGIDTARLDAELILAFSLGLSRVQLYTQFDRPLQEGELKKIKALIKRRALREPLAYLRGMKEFFSMEFVVSPAVLIPRPETELLVEEAIRLLQNPPSPLDSANSDEFAARRSSASTCHPFPKGGAIQSPPLKKGDEGGFKIIDIGTGSGCIAVVLSKHLPAAQVWAVDASVEALEIAATNVKKHGVEDQVRLKRWDLLKEEWKQTPAEFDLIVSNPPYIPTPQLAQLAPEISYEPKIALEAGVEGLEFYPHLLRFAASHLKPGGWLVFEMGAEQAERLKALSETYGFSEVTVVRDLAEQARVLKMQKSPPTPL